MDYNDLLYAMRLQLYARGLSQKDVAEHFGIDPGNLSKILTGVTKPRANFFIELADYLGITFLKNLSL